MTREPGCYGFCVLLRGILEIDLSVLSGYGSSGVSRRLSQHCVLLSGAAAESPWLRSGVLRVDALLAEQATKALYLAAQLIEPLGQAGKVRVRGCPLVLTSGLLCK